MSPRLVVRDAITKSAGYLSDKGCESPRLDAELLLAHVLNTDRLRLYLEWDKPLTEIEIAGYRELIRRRGQQREPVARILGKRQFYGRDFQVTADVFAPRPDTEGLVERALDFLRMHPSPPTGGPPAVFEPCTGSGCIIISLACENPTPDYHASELSERALAIARRNAEVNKAAQRVSFRQGDLFAGFDGPLWLVVSNPPYIREGEFHELPPEVRQYDPTMALVGGPDGLDVVRRLVDDAAKLLQPGGALMMEIGEEQGLDVEAILTRHGSYTAVRIERDFNQHDRYALARRR